MRLVHQTTCASVYCGNSLAAWPDAPVHCIITDPPYSDRTHAGHTPFGHRGAGFDGARRMDINYDSWDADSVDAACKLWADRCSGWIVVLTDHVLAPLWEHGLSISRYVFAPLPFLSPGSRVRLSGDGPSSWTCWIVAARPRHEPYNTWGTLPGGYVFPPESMPLVGGKPLSLMKALVNDYSRPGDLVCDPCCGAGTTGRAALDCGRRFVGIDINPEHCELTRQRLRQQVLNLGA